MHWIACQLGSGEGVGTGGCRLKARVENKSTRGGGGRVGGHTQGCKGTVLNREVVNLVWAGYPTLYCVPSFSKGLSPWSRVCGGGIKLINRSTGEGRRRGALKGNPRWFVNWQTHAYAWTTNSLTTPRPSICQSDPAGGEATGGLYSIRAMHSNDIPSDQAPWYVCKTCSTWLLSLSYTLAQSCLPPHLESWHQVRSLFV